VNAGGPVGTVRNTRINKRPIALMRGKKLHHGMRVGCCTLKAGLRTHKSANGDRGNREPDECAPVSDWFHSCLILCHNIASRIDRAQEGGAGKAGRGSRKGLKPRAFKGRSINRIYR
jgi:hypothetical protein